MINQKKKKYGKTKIISGYLGGQIIKIIHHKKLYPTLHRIKETIFNWISYKIYNAKCLDCFGGSGSLGIEAISRYAKYVTILEKNKYLFYHLTKNINRLKIKNIQIIHTNSLHWIKKNPNNIYDIIFLDPPYFENILQKMIYLINKYQIIKNNGYIYIEHYKFKNIQYPKNWNLYKTKNTNNINYKLYIYKTIK